ncbi:fumarylacetoacetate hydrolase family protein [Pseudokineococcus basanitobsidens]|uniref:Fumarylacetoacetate hydrolase family protein n=1 Tax=Pseudokineococcus basanitobsidens TaxID=1926649 RepID=A0ABU8RK82_9ACTN
MRIARFTRDDDISYGFVEGEPGDERLHVVTGDPLYTPLKPTGVVVGMDEVRLLSPVIPRSKVVGVGRNYRDHAREMGNDVPSAPLLFLVPNTAVVGPDDPIVLPSFSEEVDYEGELAVVIGRICKDVPRERVSEVVYGYTCANDVTARDAQRGDGQWARAKGFDSSCPLGPWIATDLDTADLALRTRLDGGLVQDGRTSDMVFDVPDLVAAVSAAFTLLPGDVILTGTPAGVGRVEAGQRVEVDIEGIGVLGNPVVAR